MNSMPSLALADALAIRTFSLRLFDSDMIKTGCDLVDLESDEELELALRRELAEMVRANGVSDPDVLLDMVIEGIVESGSEA